MNRKSQLIRSRANWKLKATKRAKCDQYSKREIKRIKKERDIYKEKMRIAGKRVEELECIVNLPTINNKTDLIYISLNLFLNVRLSFRAVSKVLEAFKSYLGISKAPCPQTIINWILRLTIVKIQQSLQLFCPQIKGDLFSNGFIWMIDISIGLGEGKILSVLALNCHHHSTKPKAPTLQDVHCVGVSVSSSWQGENVAKFLKQIISALGRPAAFLKDGGKELEKAVTILSKRGLHSQTIDDVSHVVANIIKHEYAVDDTFNVFMSACSNISKKFKQTVLACLIPPKISTKARFMNIHRLVRWADALLKHSAVGRAGKESMLSKLRSNLDDLPDCKTFISRFHRDTTALLECQKILKTKGLKNETWNKCKKIIEIIPKNSKVYKDFVKWGLDQLVVARNLAMKNTGLPISTDSIESLFGIGKQLGTGEIKDANRIAARLPAMCGGITKKDAVEVINITVEKQNEFFGELPSLTKQRRMILPNPGSIENLSIEKKEVSLSLIPRRAKNQTKNSPNTDIIDNPMDIICPKNQYKKREIDTFNMELATIL